MIIKAVRIPTSDSLSRIKAHLFRGDENEAIHVLRGSEADLDDLRRPALDTRSTYAIRHFIVAPQVELSSEAYLAVVDDLAEEFGFDAGLCVVVLHRKRRHTAASPTHLHVLVPEVDPATGGVLDCAHDYLRHEKISRLVEWRHGHPLLEGEHLEAVLRRLSQEGRHDLCRALHAAYPVPSGQREAFSSDSAAKAKRVAGIDLARIKHSIRDAWATDPNPNGLASWLVAEGLTLRLGDQPRTLVLSKDDTHVGALHRFLGLKKAPCFTELQHVPDLVAQRLDAERRNDDPRRDTDDPRLDRGDAGPARRRRRGPRPDDSGHTVGGIEGDGRPAGKPSGPAPSDRTLDAPRLRRRAVEARIRGGVGKDGKERLLRLREMSAEVAMSAIEVSCRWIADGLAAIEAERRRLLGPDDHLDDEVRRLAHQTAMMLNMREMTEADLRKEKARLSQSDIEPGRKGLLRWFGKKPVPASREKLLGDVQAAEARYQNAIRMHAVAAQAHGREAHRVARCRREAREGLDANLLALDRRASALHTFRHLLDVEPQLAYAGERSFEAWISAQLHEPSLTAVEDRPSPSHPRPPL